MAKPAWPFCFFTQKQVFGPRTAKSRPIWIKFCIHLLLYGMHLWANLDRDWRVGGSRPNQNGYVIVILVTHPKSYMESTDSPDFGDKSSKWRQGRCYREKFQNFVAWAEPDPKTAFFAFIGSLQGATENAGVENAIRAKLQGWKMQEWKMRE